MRPSASLSWLSLHAGAAGGAGVATLIVFTIDLERPRLLVTVNLTYLAPAWRKVCESMMPVPSAVLAPPGPSGPSSCQR